METMKLPTNSLVAQIFNLPYRRIVFCIPQQHVVRSLSSPRTEAFFRRH